MIAVNQVSVNMGFTLTASNGRVISDTEARSARMQASDVAADGADARQREGRRGRRACCTPIIAAMRASRSSAHVAARHGCTSNDLRSRGVTIMKSSVSIRCLQARPRRARRLRVARASAAAAIRQSVAHGGQRHVAARQRSPPTRRSTSRSNTRTRTRRDRRSSSSPARSRAATRRSCRSSRRTTSPTSRELELSTANFQVLER